MLFCCLPQKSREARESLSIASTFVCGSDKSFRVFEQTLNRSGKLLCGKVHGFNINFFVLNGVTGSVPVPGYGRRWNKIRVARCLAFY